MSIPRTLPLRSGVGPARRGVWVQPVGNLSSASSLFSALNGELSCCDESTRDDSFSLDGRWLASGSSDQTVRIWDPASGKELRQLNGHRRSIVSVAFSPDGEWLASGSQDETVRIWDRVSGKEFRQLRGHKVSVMSVAFSPDGKWLASSSHDQTVRIWDVMSGKELRQLRVHKSFVISVAFSPSGKWLAGGSDDNTVRIWEAASGKCMAVLAGLPEGWAAFTPDGRYRVGDNVGGNFWHAINLCRFEVGELDEFIPGLRLKPDEPLF